MEHHPATIHKTLAWSYLGYFISSMVGLFVDSFLAIQFQSATVTMLAITCFILGPLLIAWAQITSRHCHLHHSHPKGMYFLHGPYKYMRNPTHLGLLILVTGYALVSGSVVFFIVTFAAYMLSNVLFKKYESILHDTYKEHYGAYRARVRKIL